jgi:hypothetical protein
MNLHDIVAGLLPLARLGVKDRVFTADRAGEVAAILAEAERATATSQPASLSERVEARYTVAGYVQGYGRLINDKPVTTMDRAVYLRDELLPASPSEPAQGKGWALDGKSVSELEFHKAQADKFENLLIAICAATGREHAWEDLPQVVAELAQSPEPAQGGGHQPSDNEEATQPWYDLAWQTGARRHVSFAGDELESLTFTPGDFEAFCAALGSQGRAFDLLRQARRRIVDDCHLANAIDAYLAHPHPAPQSTEQPAASGVGALAVELKAAISTAVDAAGSVAVHKRPSMAVEWEHRAHLLIDRITALSTPSGARETAGAETGPKWIPFSERMPKALPTVHGLEKDKTLAPMVLMTNNLKAIDSTGRMSHVWWARGYVHEDRDGRYAFAEGGQRIWEPTHWLDPLAAHDAPSSSENGGGHG